MINTGYLWPGLLRSNRVRTVKSTTLCDFKRWWKRNTLPPPVYHTINNSDSSPQTRSDTGLLPSLEPPRFFSLNLRRQPGGWGGDSGWSLSWKHCRASREAPEGRSVTAKLDLTCGGGWGWGVRQHQGAWLNALLGSGVCPRVSQCQSDVHHAPESTLGFKKKNGVKQRKKGGKNSAQVSVEPKITLAWVTKSLAFFLSVSFLYRGGIQTPFPPPSLPKKKKRSLFWTVSCHGNFSGQCSPCCCSCSALQDQRFATQTRTLSGQTSRGLRANPTNRQPSAVYRLCERLLGTFACCPA